MDILVFTTGPISEKVLRDWQEVQKLPPSARAYALTSVWGKG